LALGPSSANPRMRFRVALRIPNRATGPALGSPGHARKPAPWQTFRRPPARAPLHRAVPARPAAHHGVADMAGRNVEPADRGSQLEFRLTHGAYGAAPAFPAGPFSLTPFQRDNAGIEGYRNLSSLRSIDRGTPCANPQMDLPELSGTFTPERQKTSTPRCTGHAPTLHPGRELSKANRTNRVGRVGGSGTCLTGASPAILALWRSHPRNFARLLRRSLMTAFDDNCLGHREGSGLFALLSFFPVLALGCHDPGAERRPIYVQHDGKRAFANRAAGFGKPGGAAVPALRARARFRC